jgi:hypothetical protein
MIKSSASRSWRHAELEDADVRPHPDDSKCYLCVVADGLMINPAAVLPGLCARCVISWHIRARCPISLGDLLRAVDETVANDQQAGLRLAARVLVRFYAPQWRQCRGVAHHHAEASDERQQKSCRLGAAVFVPFAASPVPYGLLAAMSDGV